MSSRYVLGIPMTRIGPQRWVGVVAQDYAIGLVERAGTCELSLYRGAAQANVLAGEMPELIARGRGATVSEATGELLRDGSAAAHGALDAGSCATKLRQRCTPTTWSSAASKTGRTDLTTVASVGCGGSIAKRWTAT